MSETDHLLAAIADPSLRRNDVAVLYARYLGEGLDWPTINRAIMERWSQNALVYIKERAWKIRTA